MLTSSSSGGTYPYSYSWSTGSSQSSINLTSPGLYWLITSDNNLCLSDTTFYNVSCITIYKTDSVVACDNFTWVNGVTYNNSIRV